MQNQAILIADAHIKSRLWTNFPAIKGDSYEAIKQITKEAGKDGTVISCGDLFDSVRPSSTDLDCVATLLRNIKELLYVDGNHDTVTPSIVPSLGTLGTNSVHLTEEPTERFGVDFYGIDYCNNKDSLIESLSKVGLSIKARKSSLTPILIMHQSLDVFFMHSIISLQEIRELLDAPCNIFVGDIHMRKTLESPQGICQSPGPLVPQDIGQAKHDQYATRLLFTGNQLKLEDIPVFVRQFLFLESPEELEKALSDVQQENRYPLSPVFVVKAPASYKLPKEISQREDVIVILDTASEVLKKEALVKATASSLEEAVKAEIAETAGDSAEILTKLVLKLMHSEVPDEDLLELLKKWKVVMV